MGVWLLRVLVTELIKKTSVCLHCNRLCAGHCSFCELGIKPWCFDWNPKTLRTPIGRVERPLLGCVIAVLCVSDLSVRNVSVYLGFLIFLEYSWREMNIVNVELQWSGNAGESWQERARKMFQGLEQASCAPGLNFWEVTAVLEPCSMAHSCHFLLCTSGGICCIAFTAPSWPSIMCVPL